MDKKILVYLLVSVFLLAAFSVAYATDKPARREFDHIGNFNFRVEIEGVGGGISVTPLVAVYDYNPQEAGDLKSTEPVRGPKRATKETLCQIE